MPTRRGCRMAPALFTPTCRRPTRPIPRTGPASPWSAITSSGTDPKHDPVLHAKTGDATKFIGADVSRDGKWIFFAQQNGWDKNDLYYQPLQGEPTAAMADNWKPIVVGKPFLYSLTPWQGQGYILTNEGATRFPALQGQPGRSARARNGTRSCRNRRPRCCRARQSSAIASCSTAGKRHEPVEIRDLDGKLVRTARSAGPRLPWPSWKASRITHELFYGFDNFTTAAGIFQTSVTDPAQKLWAKIKFRSIRRPMWSSKNCSPRRTEPRCRCSSCIARTSDRRQHAVSLYGYGGFGLSQTPFFAAGLYPFLEAGGGFAW